MLQSHSCRNRKRTQAFFAAVFCGLNSGGFLITKEKTMHLHIDRTPPSTEDMVRRLTERNAAEGRSWDGTTATIPPAVRGPCPGCLERRTRSLKHCHLPAEPKARHAPPRDTGAYVPELAARIDDDLNLSDGARRCARKLAEYIYRRNRETRQSEITVTYLAKALGRCRRTVQRYLRQLESEGYIQVHVVASDRTRMCFGLLVRLLTPLFPPHRRQTWPLKVGKPDATALSQKNSQRYKTRIVSRAVWAFYCCECVWRSYMKNLPPLSPFPITA
jgi:hypothetical protein